MNDNDSRNIALFIDFENLPYKRDFPKVLDRFRGMGRLLIKRAYADWSDTLDAKNILLRASIELIQVSKYKDRLKNAVDIRLALDALEVALRSEHIDTMVVLAGDSDYVPLVSKLREQNKYVIFVGLRQSSSDVLKGFCDEFINLDEIVGRLDRDDDSERSKKRAEAISLMKRAIEILLDRGTEPKASIINQRMQLLDSEYNLKNLGFSAFSQFLDYAKDLEDIKLEKLDNGETKVILGSIIGGTSAPSADAKPGTNNVAKPSSSEDANSEIKNVLLLLHALLFERDSAAYSELNDRSRDFKNQFKNKATNTAREAARKGYVEIFQDPDPEQQFSTLVKLTEQGTKFLEKGGVFPDWYWSVRYRCILSKRGFWLKLEQIVQCWEIVRMAETPLTEDEACTQIAERTNIRRERIKDYVNALKSIHAIEFQSDDHSHIISKFSSVSEVWNELVGYYFKIVSEIAKNTNLKAFRDLLSVFQNEDPESVKYLNEAIAQLEKKLPTKKESLVATV